LCISSCCYGRIASGKFEKHRNQEIEFGGISALTGYENYLSFLKNK